MDNNLTVTDHDKLFQIMLTPIDSYTEDAKCFVNFLKSNSYGFSLEGFKQYSKYLNLEKNGKRLSANTFNKRILGAKKRLKYVFQQSPDSFNTLKKYKFEEALKSVKLKKINSVAVSEENILTDEEIKKLIFESEDKTVSMMIEFLYATGLRISEMLGILLTDIKKTNGKYIITVLGKRSKERKIFASVQLINKIKEIFSGNKYLFEHDGKMYNRISISNRIAVQGRILLGKKISAHTLRHCFATETLRKTNNLKGVSKYLGHSSVSTTANLYIHNELTWQDLNQ